jgi:hypothetical protein
LRLTIGQKRIINNGLVFNVIEMLSQFLEELVCLDHSGSEFPGIKLLTLGLALGLVLFRSPLIICLVSKIIK